MDYLPAPIPSLRTEDRFFQKLWNNYQGDSTSKSYDHEHTATEEADGCVSRVKLSLPIQMKTGSQADWQEQTLVL